MYKQSISTIILASCKLENPQNVDDFKGWDKYREKFKYFFPGPSGWFYTASMDKISLWNFFFLFLAAWMAYGSSRARDVSCRSLHHSCDNSGSLTHCSRPGIKPAFKPATPQRQARSLTHGTTAGTPVLAFLCSLKVTGLPLISSLKVFGFVSFYKTKQSKTRTENFTSLNKLVQKINLIK